MWYKKVLLEIKLEEAKAVEANILKELQHLKNILQKEDEDKINESKKSRDEKEHNDDDSETQEIDNEEIAQITKEYESEIKRLNRKIRLLTDDFRCDLD